MFANGFIDIFELNSFKKVGITTIDKNNREFANDYYLEEIRKEIISIFGEDFI